jgi:hypothetical protein
VQLRGANLDEAVDERGPSGGALQERLVVGYQEHGARVRAEPPREPGFRARVEVVRRLVEE